MMFKLISIKQINSTEELMNMYPDRFQGLGKFDGLHRLVIRDDVEPVRHPPTRRAPIQFHDKIKKELNRMLDLGVIRKVRLGI